MLHDDHLNFEICWKPSSAHIVYASSFQLGPVAVSLFISYPFWQPKHEVPGLTCLARASSLGVHSSVPLNLLCYWKLMVKLNSLVLTVEDTVEHDSCRASILFHEFERQSRIRPWKYASYGQAMKATVNPPWFSGIPATRPWPTRSWSVSGEGPEASQEDAKQVEKETTVKTMLPHELLLDPL